MFVDIGLLSNYMHYGKVGPSSIFDRLIISSCRDTGLYFIMASFTCIDSSTDIYFVHMFVDFGLLSNYMHSG